MSERVVPHAHELLRVIPRRYIDDAVNAAPSQLKPDNRWNTPAFPALYCGCSLPVAIAVARLKLKRTGLTLDQLSPDRLPALREILWDGAVVDMASADGIRDAGFSPDYPAPSTTLAQTQAAATAWHGERREGVVCRSHALYDMSEERAWVEPHEPWGEVAIFVDNTRVPEARRAHRDLRWLQGDLTE